MQTGKDRFNAPLDAVKEEPAGPTPCSYELPSAFDPREKLIDMSCFMSESKREAFAGVERRLGPNVRWEGREGKKNYHFNIRGEWL